MMGKRSWKMPPRSWVVTIAWLVALVVFPVLPSQAIIAGRGSKPCPITGTPCEVLLIASYGSYIYTYPSKYDLVFFPETDPGWLFYCPQSGYVSLGTDFVQLDDEEKARVRAYLATHHTGDTDLRNLPTRMRVAEQIYRVRNKDRAFWIHWYRLMAYWHERPPEDAPAALTYRLKALALLEEALQTPLSDGQRKEYLYLAGEYHRWNKADAKAAQLFADAKAVTWADDKGPDAGRNAYLDELIHDRRRLLPPEVKSKELARWDHLSADLARLRDAANRLTWKITPRHADAESYEKRLQFLDKQIRAKEAQLRRAGSSESPVELEYLVLQYNENVARYNEHVTQLEALTGEYTRLIDEHNTMAEAANFLAKQVGEREEDKVLPGKRHSFARMEPWRSPPAETPAGAK